MILLNIKIDNLYSFQNFSVNLSYPKKITNSTIENEFLPGHPNFRYKKAIILVGSNATGKTCLGRVIKNTSDFLNSGNYRQLFSMKSNLESDANVELEIVNQENVLHEISITMNSDTASIRIRKANILQHDSYDTAHAKLKECYFGVYNPSIRDEIGFLNSKFAYPEIDQSLKIENQNETLFLKVLKAVIGTLDPSLKEVFVSKDLKNSYIIRRGQFEIIIQDGKLLNRELLSSGTIEGIDVALFISSIMGNEKQLYYCDEHFSYIQTDIEKRIFQIMLGKLKDGEQLIFTTHNMDMLDLNLPKHTFAFMRRRENLSPEIIFADSLLKRNTDSVRCAAENDLFNMIPTLSELDVLEEL